MNPPVPYACTTCNERGSIVPATRVATAADGLQWFECDEHDARDNVAEVERVRWAPLSAWLERAHAAALAITQPPAPAPIVPRRELMRAELGERCSAVVVLTNHGAEPAEIFLFAPVGSKVGYRLTPIDPEH